MRCAAVMAALAWLASPAIGLAALPNGLEGRWRATIANPDGERIATATLVERGSGFEIDIDAPGAPHLAARMAPTERAQVFQVAAARSLFGLFESEQSTDPFDGPPLLWARTTDSALVAYRVAVARDGALTLVRIALEPVETGVEMWVQLRLDGSVAEDWRIILEPVE